MFDSAELDHRISKEEYRREEPKLREALLTAQFALKDNPRFPVLMLIAGVEGAGKSETINTLAEWMDPRFIQVSGFRMPTEEEEAHPPMWRFWRPKYSAAAMTAENTSIAVATTHRLRTSDRIRSLNAKPSTAIGIAKIIA